MLLLSSIYGLLVMTIHVNAFYSNRRFARMFSQRLKATMHDSIHIENVWKKGFRDCENETCSFLPGKFPDDLVGTYYRNGLGKFQIGQEPVMHPFDADGMVSAITFQNGKCFFRNRFVRTKEHMLETKMNRICYRNVFGTQRKGGMLANMFDTKIKNSANTHAVYWSGKLLALWEAGSPYQLDADTLQTHGLSTLDGILRPQQPLSAHPRIDPLTGRLILYSAEPSLFATKITIYEMNSVQESCGKQPYELHSSKTVSIPAFGLFHDFAITPHYYLFIRCPLSYNPFPFLFGLKGLGECVKFHPDQTAELYIIPRDTSSSSSSTRFKMKKIALDCQFNFHFINAFEETKNATTTTTTKDNSAPPNIILDIIRNEKMYLGEIKDPSKSIWHTVQYAEDIPFSTLARYNVSLSNQSFDRKILDETSCVDFPVIHPHRIGKPYRYVYCNIGRSNTSSSPFQGIMKFDHQQAEKVDEWFGCTEDFLSEPIFAPSSTTKKAAAEEEEEEEEENGYILTINTNPTLSCSELLIFDAKYLNQGPIVRTPLPTYLSYGLHGMFVPGLICDIPQIIKSYQ